MANFEIAHKITAGAEGGYVNNPNDTGKETYKGISRRSWSNWEGWKEVDAAKRATGFPAILASNKGLQAQVLAFYKKNFWDVLRLDQMANQAVANELYDTAVNMGTEVAGRFLQRSLNVLNKGGRLYPDLDVDGKVGPATIGALNKHPNQEVVRKALNCLQGARYIEIAENNRSQEDFVNGWFGNRI